MVRMQRAVRRTTTRIQIHPDSGRGSRHLADGDGECGQAYVGGAGEGCGGRVAALSHLLGAPPRADVEGTVHDGVHAGVGAGEQVQPLGHALVHLQS